MLVLVLVVEVSKFVVEICDIEACETSTVGVGAVLSNTVIGSLQFEANSIMPS